jgi:hypothetical protein
MTKTMTEPNMIRAYLQMIARKGGRVKSARKSAASAANLAGARARLAEIRAARKTMNDTKGQAE